MDFGAPPGGVWRCCLKWLQAVLGFIRSAGAIYVEKGSFTQSGGNLTITDASAELDGGECILLVLAVSAVLSSCPVSSTIQDVYLLLIAKPSKYSNE